MLDPAPLLNRFTGPDRETAATLGVTMRTIVRWRTGETGVSPRNADRFAVAAGLTPYNLWPHLLEEAVAEVHRTCAWEPCGAAFIPTRDSHRYCRQRCANYASQARNRERRLAAKRERYANDPEYRAAKQAASKAYKEAAKKSLAVYDKAYRQAHDDHIKQRRRAWYEANADRVKAAERERYWRRRDTAA